MNPNSVGFGTEGVTSPQHRLEHHMSGHERCITLLHIQPYTQMYAYTHANTPTHICRLMFIHTFNIPKIQQLGSI